jgi:hypothetical protein
LMFLLRQQRDRQAPRLLSRLLPNRLLT